MIHLGESLTNDLRRCFLFSDFKMKILQKKVTKKYNVEDLINYSIAGLNYSIAGVLVALACPFYFIDYEWDRFQKWRKDIPPLPRRKRALTLPLPLPPSPAYLRKTGKGKQRTEDQLQSLFLTRLPLEIRELIYKYTLCNSTHIHIFRRVDRRLGHCNCHFAHRRVHQLRAGSPRGDICPAVIQSTGPLIPAIGEDDDGEALLPLLITCRKV